MIVSILECLVAQILKILNKRSGWVDTFCKDSLPLQRTLQNGSGPLPLPNLKRSESLD